MTSLPLRRDQFDLPGFAAWLSDCGAEIGVPTNPYEVIRYRAYERGAKRAGTHVVYAKENGKLTFSGITREHYEAFLAGELIAGMFVSQFDAKPEPRRTGAKGSAVRAKLLERDGDGCWFCGASLGEDATIEHLVPRSAGGGNKLANYALAHARCNHLAADKPLIEKIELRAKLRAEKVS